MKNLKNTPSLLQSGPFIKMGAFITVFFLSQPVFADIIPKGMTTLAENIRDAFTSPLVKVILGIMLCGSAVAYAFNKDNEKIKRNALAILIAAAILMTSTFIIDAIWSASGG